MAWLLPGFEFLHMTGILLWVGAIAVLDAKLAAPQRLRVQPGWLLPAAYTGMAIAVLTAVLLLILDPLRLENPLFLLKTALLWTAVYLTAAMHARMLRDVRSLAGPNGRLKMTAPSRPMLRSLSLAALAAGPSIAYFWT